MTFDARTGFLFVAALNLFLSIALWTVLMRRRTAALDCWCGAGVVLAVATLLLALRPVLPVALSQIVLSMLRNAIEAAAGERRSVAVCMIECDGHAVLQIEDGGPGLTPDALRQAGEPFFTTKPQGLGLGLSISRAIAAQHGGELRLANAPGGGALAELKLPLEA